jgi:ribonuclease P protein component
MRTSAPRLTRLTKRSEFQAAAGSGRRFRSAHMTVQLLERADDAGVRVGLTASRKVGGAVVRNRVRRRLRAAAREAFAGVTQSLDIVLVARTEVASAPYGALIDTMRRALARKATGDASTPRQT